MSVLSKALRFQHLMVCALLLYGCAAGSRIRPSTDASVADSEVSDSVPMELAEALPLTETKQLLEKQASGIDVAMERGQGFTKVIVDTSVADPMFDVSSLDGPPRLVIDLLDQSIDGQNATVEIDADPFLRYVRTGLHPEKARLVLDLTEYASTEESVEHQIDVDGNQITIAFLDMNSQAIAGGGITGPEESLAQLSTEQEEMMEESEDSSLDEEVAFEPAAELAEVEEEEVVGEEPVELAENDQESEEANQVGLLLDSLAFTKTRDDAGVVKISLSDMAAFELSQTAPSEYVLKVPGAQASERTMLPQIAPSGFPGIRSARASQEGEMAIVRMFIDPGVSLKAQPSGSDIIIKAMPMLAAANPDARAQFADVQVGEEVTPPSPTGDDEATARANPTGIRSDDGAKNYTGRLISLDLQDTDIDNALRIIAEVSNLNIIASDDVTGKVTLRLIDVPWDQALDVILKTHGLDQVTEGNVIRIAPVEKLRQEREALLEARRAKENLEELHINYLRVSYARVTDIQEQVETVLTERGSVSVDERTNQLVVKDITKGQDAAEELVSRLDLRTPQVLLETQIVEAQKNILRDLGFQWSFLYSESPETGNATGENFPNSIVLGGSADETGNVVNFPAVITSDAGSAITAILDSADGSRALTARLSALETEGRVKVISRPQVATVNNKQAQIKSVETIRIRLPDSGLSVATGAGASAAGGGNTAVEEIDVGIEMTVTPQASPDYYVLLDVEAKSSTFGTTIVDNIPSTIERDATSTVLIKSGQTFALGGVYRIEDTDQVQGVPFLKDIPVLGHLFRRTLIDKNDEELIFFITPHIVEGSFDPSLM